MSRIASLSFGSVFGVVLGWVVAALLVKTFNWDNPWFPRIMFLLAMLVCGASCAAVALRIFARRV